ncbi:MAG: hypothetical protein COS35_06655 [Zetaproteobacteria bacterium CG02_land_8_20_14_3_00_50_9]|nr:MAG: hypothetical protein COW62_08670 [Zetaproteobacteria bacterium CG17_big_fil_post_rev_8_21_14_2_50_50_13]PIV30449.1 MAG: hypothetical protein COS35_06655 [Zetaproteobacteria bacterium CG02_land_8_20_14_3_00_50_9]PIY55415.1 MAG: hypothetical protein COZ00_09550 [Zetaproteobacteria bacterium CG_4_10_14_0_8_um_filter_49_80]
MKPMSKRLLLSLLAVAVLSSCALAPGMNMKPGRFDVKEADTDDFRQGVVIEPINGELVAKQLSVLRQSFESPLAQTLQSDIANYQYHILAQDVLQITIWDHPELTTPAGQYRTSADSGNLVRKDGTIFYPYVGIMHVAGKTMEEVRQELTQRLSKYIEQPQVDVRVAAFRSQLVYVSGQINKAGSLAVTDKPLTVVDAIALSDGIMADADLQHATLTRNGETYEIDLFSLYGRGNSSLNAVLLGGDVLNIPDNQLNKVFVMGEVTKPSTMFVRNGKLTLAEAISDAQDFGAAANPGQIYVIRGKRSSGEVSLDTTKGLASVDRFDEKAKLEIFHLDASSPDALLLADQFHLQARDVVYVSPTELSRFSRVFKDVGSIVNTTAQTIILQRTLRK